MSPQPPVWVGLPENEAQLAAAPAAVELEAAQVAQLELSVAMHEVLSFQARWLSALPLAFTLLVSTREGGRLLLTTSKAASEAARLAQVPAFVGSEIGPLALAAEHDRASSSALAAWCAEKLKEPGFRLTPQVAVDLPERGPEQGWTVERVLRAYGARLEAVCTGQEVPW